MAVDTVKRNARQRAWNREHMEAFQVNMAKGTKDKLIAAAEAKGMSRSKYLQIALDKMLIEDGFEPVLKPQDETEKDPE